MASSSPVILILGAGARVGQHVAQSFAAKGYKVALTARRAKHEEDTADQINIAGDLSDPSSVPGIFRKVTEKLGIPSVVVYNAAVGPDGDPKDPLSQHLDDFRRGLNVNTLSVVAAAQKAVLGFRQLPESASKTFIFTGNILNITIIGEKMSMGLGKSATAHMIHNASAAYKDEGIKFYYADERNPDGSPVYMKIDGPAHGVFYPQLAEHKTQGPWLQTFVKGHGYKDFSGE